MDDLVELATESDLEGIKPLLAAWPYKPWAGCKRWPEDHLTTLLWERFKSTLQNPHSAAWVSRCGKKVTGLVCLSMLPWDTEQLGLNAARIDTCLAVGEYTEQVRIKANLLTQALDSSGRCGVQYLSARLDAADFSGIHTLELAGFVVIDGLLTFTLDCPAEPATGLDFDIRMAVPEDADRTAELAGRAYQYDRFHADPAVTAARADALYATWLRRSCLGQAADAVLVAEDREGLVGYVTCKLQQDTRIYLGELVGTIVLVATAARARRRGVGRAMTLAAVDWFRGQGASLVDVGTQLSNIPAARLYESCGFRLAGSSISLRKLS